MPALSLFLSRGLFPSLSLLLSSVAVFISCLCQLQIFFNFLAKIRYKLIALVAGIECGGMRRREGAESAQQMRQNRGILFGILVVSLLA